MGTYRYFPISSDVHALDSIEYSTNQAHPINSDTMPKESIALGLAVLIGLAVFIKYVAKTLLGMSHDVTPVERDTNRQQVILLTLDGETASDLFFKQLNSLSYPRHLLRPSLLSSPKLFIGAHRVAIRDETSDEKGVRTVFRSVNSSDPFFTDPFFTDHFVV